MSGSRRKPPGRGEPRGRSDRPPGRGRQGRGRDELPRRVGEVLNPALDRLATSDQARAYVAWARAVGDAVVAGTRPKAFSRGCLTIECASSVWANELTYLGPQILRRMDEVAPDHPVKRFRFVVGRLRESTEGGVEGGPAAAGHGGAATDHEAATDHGAATGCEGAATDVAGQDSGPSAAKNDSREEGPTAAAYEAARVRAEGVRDERLRAAIEGALRRSSEEPPAPPVRGAPEG